MPNVIRVRERPGGSAGGPAGERCWRGAVLAAARRGSTAAWGTITGRGLLRYVQVAVPGALSQVRLGARPDLTGTASLPNVSSCPRHSGTPDGGRAQGPATDDSAQYEYVPERATQRGMLAAQSKLRR